MILNRNNLSILYRAFSTAFQTGFAGYESQWKIVATEIPSSTSENVYGWLGQIPRMREWIGDRVIKNLALHEYAIRNKTFENTVGVPREDIEDDQYGTYAPLVQELGRTAAEHPDELTFALLKNGFNQACYDGQYFFDTDHPVLDEQGATISVSNFGGGSGKAWILIDDTRAIKPLIFQRRRAANFVAKTQLNDDNVFFGNEFVYGVDARWNVGFGLWQLAYGSKQDLTPENFEAALAAMTDMKGDHGRGLGIKPRKLLVPASLRAAAQKIAKAENDAAGATNINKDVVEVVVVPWLA
ncbi:Mu-like prophage major head subunit gpT family protein [Lysobacter sp. CA199]|uniref:Mu-like prophage major head subunit gpT family protein n=1 Tax=Lysobacter sp. CA199 TaxID=3455608 RepID=UPI003F8D1886